MIATNSIFAGNQVGATPSAAAVGRSAVKLAVAGAARPRRFMCLSCRPKVAIGVLSLLIMGFLGSAWVLQFAGRHYNQQVAAYAAALPDYSRITPPEAYRTGKPVRIEVPSVGVNMPVVDGTYDQNTHQWTLNTDKAQFAAITKPANNRTGQTYIYGHATQTVFGGLLRLQPDALAYVTTDTGYVFAYKLASSEVVDPTDMSVLSYEGAPRLTLQTCTGPTLSEYRHLFYFAYQSNKYAPAQS